MESNELLQAINEMISENNRKMTDEMSKMMDKKLEPIQKDMFDMKTDISGLKEGQKSLRQDVSGMKSDISTLKDGQLKTNITLENDIGKKLSALFDGHQLDSEKIQSIKDTVENVEKAIDANDTLSRVNAGEIRRMKEKMG